MSVLIECRKAILLDAVDPCLRDARRKLQAKTPSSKHGAQASHFCIPLAVALLGLE